MSGFGLFACYEDRLCNEILKLCGSMQQSLSRERFASFARNLSRGGRSGDEAGTKYVIAASDVEGIEPSEHHLQNRTHEKGRLS